MQALILTLILIAIGWFLIIRPQQERARAQRKVVEELAVGDHVISAGGIYGTVTRVDSDTIGLAVADGVELTLARPAIARRVDDAAPAEPPVDAPVPVEDSVTDDLTDEPGSGGPA